MSWTDKIKTPEELEALVLAAKKAGNVVVHCHGCFDILHPGHLRHLTWAKAQGDLLVVTVSADHVVQKGAMRPFVPERLRAENLAALEMVDLVSVDGAEWAGPVLERLRPDLYVKGKEFEDVFDGRFGRERRLVESYGGRVRFSSGEVVYSSTEIIDRHRDRLEPVVEQIHAFCKRQAITWAGLQDRLARAETKKLVVVGETIVDRYVHTDPLGMSADAPVLVVRPRESETFVGGAAIVARHIRALGAKSRLVTVLGADPEADLVRAELAHGDVLADVVVDTSRPTILKTRYLSEGKKLLNVNVFRDHDLERDVQARLLEHLDAAGRDADAVLLCDFSYGVVTQAVIEWARALGASRGIPILGDVQCSSQLGNASRLRGITLTTPSEREARLALCDRESGVADLGVRLLAETRNRALVVTIGARGLMLLDTRGRPWDEIAASRHLHEIKQQLTIEYLPSFARHAVDPMGAGDALLAALAVGLAAGGSIGEGAFLGNGASAVAIGQMGNLPVDRESVLEVLRLQMADA